MKSSSERTDIPRNVAHFTAIMFRLLIVLIAVCLCWPHQASAQIYAWRDANGTLVLSDRKLDTTAQTFSVPGTPEVRTTRPPTAPVAGARFEGLVLEQASRQNLRSDLVRAVIQVESGFNPNARSPKGAMGLMQLMPATARALGVSDPYDPAQNVWGGTRYLRELLDRYDGDEELALAAYNAGPGAVDRYGQQVPPFRETRDYVRKISAATSLEQHHEPTGPKTVIYKIIELVDGRPIPRYSTVRPPSGVYQVLAR